MAGESPDKSVKQGAGAPGAAESDPRLSVFRPRDPEAAEAAPEGKDDPLRAAVAAWVAKADEPEAEPEGSEPDAVGTGSLSDGDKDSASASDDVAGVADEGSVEPSPTPAKEADRVAAKDSASPSEGSDPERTSVFRMPVKDSAGAADPAPADEKTTVFEAFRRNPGTGGGSAKKDSASRPDPRLPAPSTAPEAKASAAADSERTAVFRAVRPDAKGSDGAAKGADAPARPGPAEAKGSGSTAEPKPEPEAKPEAKAKPEAEVVEPEAKAPADNERTAVFRAVRQDAKGADAPARPGPADAKGSSGAAKPKPEPEAEAKPEAKPAGKAKASEPSDSERTAVFRAVRPDAKGSDGAAEAKPKAEPEPKPAGKAKASEPSGSERTAVFRAVRTDAQGSGELAKPEAKPEAKPAVKPEPKPAVKPEPKPEPKAETKPEAKPEAKPAGKAKASEPSDSERTAVFRAVRPDAGPAEATGRTTGSGGPAGPKPDPERGTQADARQAPKADFERGPKPDPERGPKADPERGSKADAKPSTQADAKPGTPAGARPGTPAGAQAGPKQAPKADSQQGTQADPKQWPKVDPKQGPAAGAKAGAERASTFVPLRGEGAGAPAKAEPQGQSKAEAKPTPPTAPKAHTPPVTHSGSERTTQQPLPPRPPLDMLAELTNNPPPPPSPMRTTVRRVKIYAPLLALLAVILGIVQLFRPLPAPTLTMTAKNSFAFEGDKPALPWPTEGQAYMAAAGLGTLGSSGEMKPVPIASVTKSMTAYIILRDHPFKKGDKGKMIDIDKTAETEGKKNNSTDNESTLDTVKEGQQISEYDAIAALMIPSANNIARLLARWDSGSQEAFVAKMNATAKDLGMTNTTYTDPSGLDATTVSTAEDQVKLGLKLVEMDALLDITRKPSWVDPSGKTWPNWNRLVPYNDSLGIKTGTTTKAGGNLLFAAQKKVGNTNQLIVGAVLAQHKPAIIDTVIAASKQLMIATQKSLEGATVVKKGDVVGYVDDGLGGRTPVVATADVQAVGWSGLTVTVKLSDGGTKIPGTAKAGTKVGVLTVGEGASQVKVPVALQRELAAPGIGSKLTRVG